MITLHSTVGSEAMIPDKPLVLINLDEKEDLVDYDKCGVAQSNLSSPCLMKFITF